MKQILLLCTCCSLLLFTGCKNDLNPDQNPGMGGVSEVDLNTPDEKWTYRANAVVSNPLSDPVLSLEEDGKVHLGGYYNGAPDSFPDLTNTTNGLMIAQLDALGALTWHRTYALLPGQGINAIAASKRGTVFIGAELFSKGQQAVVSEIDADDASSILNRSFGTSGLISTATTAIDSDDNIYLTGNYNENIGSGTIAGLSLPFSGNLYENGYLVKLNAQGELAWASSFGGPHQDAPGDMVADASGNVYLTGFYTDSATFETTQIDGFGGRDVFVVKYNRDGQLQWVKGFGNLTTDQGIAIAVNAVGEVFVAGQHSRTPGVSEKISFGAVSTSAQFFTVKLDSNGEAEWVLDTPGVFALAVGSGNSVLIAGKPLSNNDRIGNASLAGVSNYFAKVNPDGEVEYVKSVTGAIRDIDANEQGEVGIILNDYTVSVFK